MQPQEYDEIMRNLMRLAAHQDLINDKQDLTNQYKLTMPPVAIECVMNIRWEALASNQELQSDVQRLDSGLVDEDQEPPDALNSLTEDDLPSEIPSSDVVLRELEEFLR